MAPRKSATPREDLPKPNPLSAKAKAWEQYWLRVFQVEDVPWDPACLCPECTGGVLRDPKELKPKNRRVKRTQKKTQGRSATG